MDRRAYQLAEEEPGFRLKSFLMRHISRNVSQEEAAKHLGWSLSTLSHRIRLQTGFSFKQLQIAIKLDFAEKLMRECGRNVAEVGTAVGFRDPAYFSRLYRRHRGIPPSQCRHDPAAGPERARNSTCMNNLKQWGQGGMMYGSDYNDTIVPAIAPNDTPTAPKWAQPNYWTALLSPYVGGKQTGRADGVGFDNMNELNLAICPSVPTRFGYGHNAWYLSIKASIGAAVGADNNNKYVKYGRFKNASSVVLLADNQLRPPTNQETRFRNLI